MIGVLIVSDPWDLVGAGFETVAVRVVEAARREKTSQTFLLCQTDEPIVWNGKTAPFLVLCARHGQPLWPLPPTTEPAPCNFIGLDPQERRPDPPWGIETWRGGGIAGTGAVSRADRPMATFLE